MYADSEELIDFIIKISKEQQYWIKKNSEKITELAELLSVYLERIRLDNGNVDVEVISHPPFGVINSKLSELSITIEEVNFRKSLIRDYQHQLYLIKGYYMGEWLK